MDTAAVKTNLRPPGPRGQFLLGNLNELRKDRLAFTIRLAERYGPVSQFRMLGRPLYMVYHPDGVKRILQENAHNYSKESALFNPLKPVLGNGLFLSEGEFWLRQRRLMQPAFHRQKISAFAGTMTGVAEEVVESWRPSAAGGRPVDAAAEMMRLTLDVACRALFSSDIRGEARVIGEALAVLLADVTFRFDHPFYFPPSVPTLHNRRFLRAVAELDRIVFSMIEQRRRQTEWPNDLLSLLLEARDEETGQGMTDRQLRDELVTLLLAGHETTANALSWALYLLSKHPESERRVRAELDAALGGRIPTAADLPDLGYTRRVIDEAMRLFPPVWITNRVALEADEVCGFILPKGALVSLSPYATHRLPEFWENPEGFDPDRFITERSKERPHYAYFPFGGGPRLCIGKGFALMEAPLVLATILQRCRLELLAGREVRPLALATLRPDGGLPMMVKLC
jgi:cytochrome P450